MRFRLFAAALLTTLLVGCSIDRYSDVGTLGAPIDDIYKLPVAEARAFVEDKTIMIYDGGHKACRFNYFGQYHYYYCIPVSGDGTLVDYYHPDGLAFRWFPGVSKPIPFRWKLVEDHGLFNTLIYRVCSKYPSRGYNPLAGEDGGKWECDEIGRWSLNVTDVRQGDIFKLSSLRLPYTLSKQPTTLDRLIERMPNQ